MYRNMLDKMVKQDRGDDLTSPLVSKPVKNQPPETDLTMVTNWVNTIRRSGQKFREENDIKTRKAAQTRPSIPKPPKREEPSKPIELKEEGEGFVPRKSMYDNDDRYGTGTVAPFKGNPGQWGDVVRQAANKYGIPEDLFLKLVKQESAFNPKAKSSAGAIGLAQLMPGTAKDLGVDPNDPYQNVDGGARYLKEQYERFGRWDLALAAYNAGPGAVNKHGGIPPYKETQNYVRKILGA